MLNSVNFTESGLCSASLGTRLAKYWLITDAIMVCCRTQWRQRRLEVASFSNFYVCVLDRISTAKSLSEAPFFPSTNPQYDNRLFIELQVQCMKIPSSNLGRTCCVQKLFLTFRTIFVHNMFSPCSELGIFLY